VIEKIENISSLVNLQSLNLSNNYIIKIENLQLKALRKLNLSGNQIERIPPSIKHLTNLSQLNLSYNVISVLADVENLRPLKNLFDFNLIGNPLETLPHSKAYIFYNLRTVLVYNTLDVDETQRSLAIERFGKLESDSLSESLNTLEKKCRKLVVEGEQKDIEIQQQQNEIKRLKELDVHSQHRIKLLERQLAIQQSIRNDLIDQSCSVLDSTAIESRKRLESKTSADLVRKLQDLLADRPQAIDERYINQLIESKLQHKVDFILQVIDELNEFLPPSFEIRSQNNIADNIRRYIEHLVKLAKENKVKADEMYEQIKSQVETIQNLEKELQSVKDDKMNHEFQFEKLKFYADSMKSLILRRKEKLKLLKDAYKALLIQKSNLEKEISRIETRTNQVEKVNREKDECERVNHDEGKVVNSQNKENESSVEDKYKVNDNSFNTLNRQSDPDDTQHSRLDDHWDKKYQELSLEIAKLRSALKKSSIETTKPREDMKDSADDLYKYFEESNVVEPEMLDNLLFSPIPKANDLNFTDTPIVSKQ
jgi:ribosomal protein L17